VTIRALIVDDEPLARDRLRHLLRNASDIEIVGECRDGASAVEAVRTARPDLLFLDVQMPELDGFDVLRRLDPDATPIVVFVTAYDRYAIDAFEVQALDYLLKPFDRARFERTLQRVRDQLLTDPGGGARRMAAMLAALPRRAPPPRLVVRSGGRVLFLPVAEIDWIEAADNYVRLHAGRQIHVMRESLQRLETTLDPAQFVRIHRSTMVNLDRVREIQPWFHGEHVLILQDGAKLVTGRAYRKRIDRLLGRRAARPPEDAP
jgi:two-component system LytT family response regulator